jgi:capsule polysaccharide export protein KpsE/RkpR
MMNTSDQETVSRTDQDELDLEKLAGEPRPGVQAFGLAWLLWSERRFIGRIALWGTLVTIIITLLMPNKYTAQVSLMPPDQNDASALVAAVASNNALSGMAADLLGTKTPGALFVSVLQSRTVEDALVNKFDLRKVYRQKYYEGARTELDDRTDVTEDRRSGIITLTVIDEDKYRARDMAQAYINELNRVVAQSSTGAGHRQRAFLEERLKLVRQELDDSAKALAEFSSKNTLLDPKDQGKSMIDAAAELQAQLIAAQTEVHGLQSVYTDQNVRVRTAQARVHELQGQLAKVSGKPGAAGSEGAELGDYPSIRQLPGLAVPYADLYRRNKVAELVYELLTQQYEMAKLQEAKDTPSVQPLDPPAVPERKSGPKRSLITLAGLCLSGLFGMGWVLGDHAWQKIDPEHPGKVLVLDIATSIREMPIWQSRGALRIRGMSATAYERIRRLHFTRNRVS